MPRICRDVQLTRSEGPIVARACTLHAQNETPNEDWVVKKLQADCAVRAKLWKEFLNKYQRALEQSSEGVPGALFGRVNRPGSGR
jgi:hypothetical protein